MDGHAHGLAGLSSSAEPAPDRFGAWPRPLARAALAVLALLVLLAAWAPGMAPSPNEVSIVPPPVVDHASGGKAAVAIPDDDGRNNDLRLYLLVAERVKRGDNYYVAATELQRSNNYPVAPGLTVRLPTLAYLFALLGTVGVSVLAYVLVAGAVYAVWRRFDEEPGGSNFRLFGASLAFVGMANATHPHFLLLHEVLSGVLITLSFGLHRPEKGKWIGAWLAAAAALSIRELALPFVLLMAAFALWRRHWREGAAWVFLAALFAAGLAWHLSLAEAQIRPGDPISLTWIAFDGLAGFLYKAIHSSALSQLPVVLAGPVVILAVFGWTGWKAPMASFASLLLAGYALAFMIVGRTNNFYWGVMIEAFLFAGLAVLPFSAKSLWRRAFGGDHA